MSIYHFESKESKEIKARKLLGEFGARIGQQSAIHFKNNTEYNSTNDPVLLDIIRRKNYSIRKKRSKRP